MSNLDEIIDRAIEYTNLIMRRMPSYRRVAVSALRTLRNSLVSKCPADPAIRKLDDYLDALGGAESDDGL